MSIALLELDVARGQARAALAAPQAQDVQDAAQVIGDLARALDMFVGPDPVHSLCEHECMDVMGRIKGTWSKAAEVNARSALAIHSSAIAASAKGGVL